MEEEPIAFLEDLTRKLREGDPHIRLAGWTKSMPPGSESASIHIRFLNTDVSVEVLTEADVLREENAKLKKIIKEAKHTLDRDPNAMW